MWNKLERACGQRIAEASRLEIIEENSYLKTMELKTDYTCLNKNYYYCYYCVREWENKYPNSGKATWTEYNYELFGLRENEEKREIVLGEQN